MKKTATRRFATLAVAFVSATLLAGVAVPATSALPATDPGSAASVDAQTTTAASPAKKVSHKTRATSAKKTKRSKKSKRSTTTNVKQAASTASATDFTSIFEGQDASLVNAGWTTCPAPITWTVDTSALSPAEGDRQIANLTAAFATWSASTGLNFQFAGVQSFTYNEGQFSLTPVNGSTNPSRSIQLSFVPDEASSLLGGNTVGMAGPSLVWRDSKEIEGATGIFRSDSVQSMSDAEDRALFTHELGHVLGLGHAQETGDIMYSVVTANDQLGIGDITGVKTMLKPCN